jgi:hypothetical protein
MGGTSIHFDGQVVKVVREGKGDITFSRPYIRKEFGQKDLKYPSAPTIATGVA